MKPFKFFSEGDFINSRPAPAEDQIVPLSFLAGSTVNAIRELDNQIHAITQLIDNSLSPNSEVN